MNTITRILGELHAELADDRRGAPADYIPELSHVDPDLFGIALTTPDGHCHRVGDAEAPFTIQSVSKAFVYGLVLDANGPEETERRVDLEPSGDAFNEISLDPVTSKPRNAMINAGAIAITGLVPGDSPEQRFEWLRLGLSAFAGRELTLDAEVYRSETETGHRNRAIAHLLRGGGILGDRVDEDLDLYFRQCSLQITAEDLAAMGATLANGGTQPITGDAVISEDSVERVLSVMCSSGMYNASGTWIARVGVPAKSGVGGGVVAVLPGELALATYSPRLDELGNSVRGLRACEELSRRFNLHLFNSPTLADHFVRRAYRLHESGSTRVWSAADRDYLSRAGANVAVLEIQGDIIFATVERLSRTIGDQAYAQIVILDCSRVGLVDPHALMVLNGLAQDLASGDTQLVVVDPNERIDRTTGLDEVASVVNELDLALEGAELTLLRSAGFGDRAETIELADCDLCAGLDPDQVHVLADHMDSQTFAVDDALCRVGDLPDALYVIHEGSVDVRVPGPGRLSGRIAALSPGACVGDVGLIDGQPRSADVVATEPTRCGVLSAKNLAAIGESHPKIYADVLRNIMLTNLDRLRRSGTTFAERRD
ncbi:MAG: glutaminase A [Actinomycetota bacterium]